MSLLDQIEQQLYLTTISEAERNRLEIAYMKQLEYLGESQC